MAGSSSLADDVGTLWRSGWSAFMCCAAQDPSRADRRERKRAEAENEFYKRGVKGEGNETGRRGEGESGRGGE